MSEKSKSDASRPLLLHLQAASVVKGGRRVLDGLSLKIREGEHTAILGPNGCGKSTLIKLISRDLYPMLKNEPWSMRILGRDKWRLFDLRHILGIVSNDWMQMCTRDYSGYEIVLSGFFGSVGMVSGMAAGDINNDGVVELVFGSDTASIWGKLFVYRADGQDAGGGTPLIWTDDIGGAPVNRALIGSIALAELIWRRWYERHRRGPAQPRLRGERLRSARECGHAPAESAGREGLGRP